MKHIGTILLSIWLIATGLLSLLSITFPNQGLIMAILAIAAGVMLLLERRLAGQERIGAKLTDNLGMVLLSIWLIATGVLPLFGISFPNSAVILDLLAIIAGVLLLLRR